MKKTKLKGGSLSSTWLIEEADGKKYVRKECCITENREYGYNRWYSQLKRQQRYNILFPGIFPKILKVGVDKNMAYFNMEYIEGSFTAFDYLKSNVNEKDVQEFTAILLYRIGQMHALTLPSNPEIMELYLEEEVGRKWLDAGCAAIRCKDNVFETTDGQVPKFDLTGFYREMRSLYTERTENFTHGNLTLENILYVPAEKRIVFIDPYEENVIDSKLCDYSQLFQSCDGHYELHNESVDCILDGGTINFNIEVPYGIDKFRILLLQWIDGKLTRQQLDMVRLFEISQFIRMLPFKKEIDSQKMVFFYALASRMFERYKSWRSHEVV